MDPVWDTARYVVALLTLATVIPGLSFWGPAHALVGRWRRLGLSASYAILGAYTIGLGLVILFFRESLLAAEFGTQPWLFAPALACLAAAGLVEAGCRRHLTFRTMIGVPELSGTPSAQPLLDRGVYARMRHPRYVAVLLGVCAAAFFSNYLALYLLCPACLGLLYGMTRMEERELVARFGEEYMKYQRRVPRFMPSCRRKRP